MINVIKMDLYRMVKNKATWLIFLASMLMMFASIFMTSQDLAYYNSNPTALQDLQANGDEVNWGIYIGSVKPEWCTGTEVPLMELVAVNVKSKLLLMFLVVFVTYFAGSEGLNGFKYNALIAGFTEIGETVEETVKREVMEEAGIKVNNIRYYKSQPWGSANDILLGFFCDVKGNDEISMDTNELKYADWVQRDEIILQPGEFSLTNEMMKLFKENKVE